MGEMSTTRSGTAEQVAEHRAAIEASLKETPAAVLAVSRGGCPVAVTSVPPCGAPVHIKKSSLSTDPTKVGGNGKPVHWTIYHWCKRQVCPKAGRGYRTRS